MNLKPLPASDMVFQKQHYSKYTARDLAKEKESYLAFSTTLHPQQLNQLNDKNLMRQSVYNGIKDIVSTSRLSELMEQKRLSVKPDVQLTLPLTIKQTKMSFTYDSAKNLQQNVNNFIEKMSVTDEQIKKLMLETTSQVETNSWYEHRMGRITASNFYQVCTRVETLRKKPNESTESLLNKLLGLTSVPSEKIVSDMEMQWNLVQRRFMTT